MCLGGWHSRTCWYAEVGVRRKEESWVTAFLMMVPFTQIRANKRKNLSVEGGRQWFSCRTSCVPFSSHLLLSSSNSGHEIDRKKKNESKRKCVLLLRSFIHSTDVYHLQAFFEVLLLLFSCFSRVWLFVTPWTVAHQTPLSMGFPRQEHWRGLSFPPPGDLPDPQTELKSPALAGGFFATEPPGKHSPRFGDCQSSWSLGIFILLGMVYTCVHTKST